MSNTIGVVPTAPAAPAPTFHVNNISGAPTTTILGVLAALQGVLVSLQGGVLPANAAGWIGLLLSASIAVFGALTKG